MIIDNRFKNRYLKKDGDGFFILREDFLKVTDGMSLEEKENVINEFNRKGIMIRDEVILTKDRKRSSDAFWYGQISGIGATCYDIPKKSKIEYDNVGNIIYTDFSELEEFLERKFIPNYVKKKIVDEYDEESNYLYIRLKDLIEFKLSEIEFSYTMNYLKKKGIYVVGTNHTLNKEFSNYKYFHYFKDLNGASVSSFSKEELNEKLKAYCNSGKNNTFLKNEIILNCRRYVNYVVASFCGKVGESVDDLISYGYEGLIVALDKFDITKGISFLVFAKVIIDNLLLEGIAEINNYKNPANFYSKYIQVRKEIEELEGESIWDEQIVFDKTIDRLVSDGIIGFSKKSLVNYKNLLRIREPILYGVLGDEVEFDSKDCDICSLYEEQDVFSLVESSMLKYEFLKRLEYVFSCKCYFTEREINVLLEKIDGVSDNDIAKEYGITGSRVQQIKKNAYKKIYQKEKIKKLRDYVE